MRAQPWVLTIVVVGLQALNAIAAVPGSLEEALAQLRNQESAIRRLEVTYVHRYVRSKKSPRRDDVARSTVQVLQEVDERIRCIHQEENYRTETTGDAESIEGEKGNHATTSMYDGSETRLLVNDAIANIVRGSRRDVKDIFPHMVLFHQMIQGIPLSVYLGGDDAIRSFNPQYLRPGISFRSVLKEKEIWEGIDCWRISLEQAMAGQGLPIRYEIWMDPLRGLLPIRLIVIEPRVSLTIPTGEGRLTDLREISPGVWMFGKATFEAFHKKLIKENNEQVRNWLDEYVVEAATTNVDYPDEFFRNLEIPKRAAVYHVRDDRIENSYVEGAPVARRFASAWIMLVTLNVVFVALILWYFARRQLRQ